MGNQFKQQYNVHTKFQKFSGIYAKFVLFLHFVCTDSGVSTPFLWIPLGIVRVCVCRNLLDLIQLNSFFISFSLSNNYRANCLLFLYTLRHEFICTLWIFVCIACQHSNQSISNPGSNEKFYEPTSGDPNTRLEYHGPCCSTHLALALPSAFLSSEYSIL